MSTHVRPYLISYQYEGKKHEAIILLETTRNRKKEWILRAKGHWEDEWSTVVNVTREYAAVIEEFNASENMTLKSGLTYIRWYWNLMEYAAMTALLGFHVRPGWFEDAICSVEKVDSFQLVHELPEPHMVKPNHSTDRDPFYFNYAAMVEEKYKKIKLRIRGDLF